VLSYVYLVNNVCLYLFS